MRLWRLVGHNIFLFMPSVSQSSSKDLWSSKDPLWDPLLCSSSVINHNRLQQHWTVAAHSVPQLSPPHISCGVAQGLRCHPLLVPLALQAASDRVRAHLHALLATKDVPVAMEPHACRRYRVNSTINAGKHSSDTRVRPCRTHRGSPQELDEETCRGWQLLFQVPFWEYQRNRKSEVLVWLVSLFFSVLFDVKSEFLSSCTERFHVALWGFGLYVHPVCAAVVDSGLEIDAWF